MKKPKPVTIKKSIVLEVPVAVRFIKVGRNELNVVAEAKLGLASASGGATFIHGQTEDVHPLTERVVANALNMLKQTLASTEEELGVRVVDVRSRPMRRRILDYVEPTIKEFAFWAGEVVDIYKSLHYGLREDNYTVLKDFLGNLRHWADAKKIDWDAALGSATWHYKEEIKESKLPIEGETKKKGKKRHGHPESRR